MGPSPIRRAAALLPVLAVAGLAGCGGGGGGGGGGGAANSTSAGGTAGAEAVEIVDFAYAPAHLTVPQGATVEFTNEDSTPHTATAAGGSFDSDAIKPGKSAEVSFDQTGSFAYYCAFHPFMKGTITVE